MTGRERTSVPRGVAELAGPLAIALTGSALLALAAAAIAWAEPDQFLRSVFWRLLRDDLAAVGPSCATGALGCLVGLLLSRRSSGLSWFSEHPRTVAASATLLCLLVSLLAFRGRPLAMDEVAPLFQARVFDSGQLAARFAPEQLEWLFPPGFLGVFYFVEQATGRVVSAYWPGLALLLAPFELVGAGCALNPLLAGLSIWLVRYVASALTQGDREATGAAMILLLAAPAFVVNGASFYAMNAHLCANLAFVALLLSPTSARLVAAGAVGGLALSLHNPLPHLLFAWPWWLLQVFERDRFRRLGALLAGYVPVGAVLVLGWYQFADGIRGAGAPLVGASALSAPSAQLSLTRVLGFAKLLLWSPLPLVPLAAWGAVRHARISYVRCLLGSALSTLVAYLFVKFDQGHGWGYRYFHSAYATLPLLAAVALAQLGRSSLPRWREPLLRSTLGWGLAALVVLVPQRSFQVARHVREHRAQLVSGSPHESCVHFVWPFGDYSVDLVANRPSLQGDLYLYDHGRERVGALLRQAFPNVRLQARNRTDAAYCGSLDEYRALALRASQQP